ncbi:MAG: 3-dehydroquinate synthase [Treponema sp.]|nr:3-dehydroquinate synthase [Treponema sp.]
MKTEFKFNFGNFTSHISLQDELPSFSNLNALAVCDQNTENISREILKNGNIPLLVLESGEQFKTWESVEKIIRFASDAGLSRDGIFIGIGGGVITDLTGFAASIYMRGARLFFVSTTLLGMVDAGLGGKTGFDLTGIRNLAGSFYPAEQIFMPLKALDSLPEREWKSGLAELIKTAILCSEDFFALVKNFLLNGRTNNELLRECISRSIAYKGSIVESDPKETSNLRMLLNLGHTFAHALESAAGPGKTSHGEAVAWGIMRSLELGVKFGITPPRRAAEIKGILLLGGYETRVPHPLIKSADDLLKTIISDKKQKSQIFDSDENKNINLFSKLRFIIPDEKSSSIVSFTELNNNLNEDNFLNNLFNGDYNFEE